MISYIKGKIIFKEDSFVIVKSGNIGYKVFVLPNLNYKNNEIELFTHLNVKKDGLSLYGFSSYEELKLFELLISVSGIGPKSGQNILSLTDPDTIKLAIVDSNPNILASISGIGEKIAERITLGLKNKFSVSDLGNIKNKEIINNRDAVDALVTLGYTPSDAKRALLKVPEKIKNVEEKIKIALQELSAG